MAVGGPVPKFYSHPKDVLNSLTVARFAYPMVMVIIIMWGEPGGRRISYHHRWLSHHHWLGLL